MTKTSTAVAPELGPTDGQLLLRWQVHPARQRKSKTAVVAVVAAFVGALGYLVFKSLLPPITMVLALLASLSDFLLPTTYLLTRRSACAESFLGRRRIEWSSVRRALPDAAGIRLSPYIRPTVLDGFRGVYLRFAGNRQSVLETVEKMRTSADD